MLVRRDFEIEVYVERAALGGDARGRRHFGRIRADGERRNRNRGEFFKQTQNHGFLDYCADRKVQ